MRANELSVILVENKTINQIKMFQFLDNETVKSVITGERDYDDVPIEDPGNEIVKGYFFKGQSDFIGRFGDGNPLCSVINNSCLKDKCQLYAGVGHKNPICREYKMYFKGIGNGELLAYVEQEFMKALLKAQKKFSKKSASQV
jgi:hypothetical protein